MLNSQKKWYDAETTFPSFGKEVLALVEADTKDELDYPFIDTLVLEEIPESSDVRWRVVNYHPQIEEEYLQQYFTVKMWRYL